ncbi:hypothetical protein [Pseudoxanthomonas mexicana]
MKRSMMAAGAALLCLCGTLAAQTAAPPGAAKLVTYLFEVFRGDEAILQSMREQMPTDPTQRAMMEGSMAAFDVNALAARLDVPLSRLLTPQESEHCLALIASDSAADLVEAGRRAATLDDLLPELERLPAPKKDAIAAMFEAPCFKKTLAYINSAEAQQVSSDYGKSLVCDYLAKTDPEKSALAKQHGLCP